MKLEETENLKLQYVNYIQATDTQIKNIHNSDIDLSNKITKILNKYEKKNIILKVNYPSKNGVTIVEDTDTAVTNATKRARQPK